MATPSIPTSGRSRNLILAAMIFRAVVALLGLRAGVQEETEAVENGQA